MVAAEYFEVVIIMLAAMYWEQKESFLNFLDIIKYASFISIKNLAKDQKVWKGTGRAQSLWTVFAAQGQLMSLESGY